ncbi:MAG: hypothetical protein WC077_08160, partial [Bacteroidales bacterium]
LTHAGTTSHLFSHLLHQQALHLRTSALTQHEPTKPRQKAPLTHAGTTSHLFSHLLHQQTLHPRTSALTQHEPTS